MTPTKALIILEMMLACGCGTRTTFIDSGVVGRLAEPTSTHIYTWDGVGWVKSTNAVMLPVGEFFGPPPPNATSLPSN